MEKLFATNVMLSEAKHLNIGDERPFASLRVTRRS